MRKDRSQNIHPNENNVLVAIAILGITVNGAPVYAGNEENENKSDD
jgi:hypothetical protein